jgi:hypothetical protein
MPRKGELRFSLIEVILTLLSIRLS